jgi:hypothetical protein
MTLCVDQSGSMATSMVYPSIFAAVLASIRSLSTRLVVFDTAVVDLTEQLADPVDVLFGTQLGPGGRAVRHPTGRRQGYQSRRGVLRKNSMANALQRTDIVQWAAGQGISLTPAAT